MSLVMPSPQPKMIFSYFSDASFLRCQESHSRQLLQFIDNIESGHTWKKYQLLGKLKGILINQAKVSLLIQDLSENEKKSFIFARNVVDEAMEGVEAWSGKPIRLERVLAKK